MRLVLILIIFWVCVINLGLIIVFIMFGVILIIDLFGRVILCVFKFILLLIIKNDFGVFGCIFFRDVRLKGVIFF